MTLLLIFVFLTEDEVHDWGWRVPFAIGGLGALVVLWMRRTMDESLTTEQLAEAHEGKARSAGSLRTLFVNHWKPLLLCFLITMGGTIAFYTYSVNAPAIIKSTYKDAPLTATWINLIGLILLMVLQPFGGLLSDKIGRKPLLVGFGAGGVVYTYFLLTLLPQTRDPFVSVLLVAIGYVILTGYTSINAVVKAELFPYHIRALGVGLGYARANSVFGGTAPVIYAIAKSTDRVGVFITYVTACIAISLLVYIFALKNKAETPLDFEQGAAFDWLGDPPAHYRCLLQADANEFVAARGEHAPLDNAILARIGERTAARKRRRASPPGRGLFLHCSLYRQVMPLRTPEP